MPALPPFHYPVTRSYPWPFFTPLVLVSTLIALAVLVPLNVALTGYQVISSTSKDFNVAPYHWFNRFSSAPKPGTVCKPYNLYAGDIVYTTYSLFHYTIITPNTGSSAASPLPYKGTDLSSCDVFSLGIDANAMSRSVVLTANVLCNSPDFPVLMRTSWTPWGLNSDVSKRDLENLVKENYPDKVQGPAAVSRLLVDASYDLFFSMIANAADGSTAYAFSATYLNMWCPAASLASGINGCTSAISDDKYDIASNVTGLLPGDALIMKNGVPTLQNEADYVKAEPLNNVLQILNAAVRLDLGRVLPNNVLTNQDMFDSTIDTIPTGNNAYGNWLVADFTSPGDNNLDLPLQSEPSAVINVDFNCTFYYAKSWGETLEAVIVATFTMFNTGWAVAMLVARYFAQRKAGPDEGHAVETPRRPARTSAKKSSYLERGLDYLEKAQGEGESE